MDKFPEQKMSNKIKNIAITLIILIVGILIAMGFSNQKTKAMRHKPRQKTKQVKLLKVEKSEIKPMISVGGTLKALNKIEIFAEVSGVLEVTKKPFREGNRFKKGEILIRINDDVYANNVLARKSSLLNQLTLFLPDFVIDFPNRASVWESYLEEFSLQKPLLPLPAVKDAKEKYFIASKNIYNLYYTVKSMEATLEKYTIRAPYNGVVSESNINPGTLVRAGQKLGEFNNTEIYELEAPLNLADLPYVKKGDKALLKSVDRAGEFTGVIARINDKVDRNSQTVNAYIILRDSRLKEGMYLTAQIESSVKIEALKIPAKWLAGENKIFVKADSGFVQRRISVLRTEGDMVIISGLQEGMEILAQEASLQGF